MKLNTHDRTPSPKNIKFIMVMFAICTVLTYGMFAMVSFCCFFYAHSIVGGFILLLIPVLMTAFIGFSIKDMTKSHIEIRENEIYVADYYFGFKREKHISISDITSAEIHTGYSREVKGCRFRWLHYIVFKNGNKYLFKIIALPETEEIFKQYLRQS